MDGARKYILDSGASFHLVDPGTLTEEEKQTIETIPDPITLETANGEVTVDQRCLIRVKEMDVQLWAFLHTDTVCVISLGLIVGRAGFTFNWQPGKAPTLTRGKKMITSQPSFNVPFIYASNYLDARKAHTLARTADPARGNPFALPSFDQVVAEEMKGMEDLIPPPPLADDDAADAKLEETLKRSRQRRSRP